MRTLAPISAAAAAFIIPNGRNGATAKNGIIIINDNIKCHTELVEVRLPKIKHVEATFTDAILVDNKIYFLRQKNFQRSKKTQKKCMISFTEKDMTLLQ